MKTVVVIMLALMLIAGVFLILFTLKSPDRECSGRTDDTDETEKAERSAESYTAGIKSCTYCELVRDNNAENGSMPEAGLRVTEQPAALSVKHDIGSVMKRIYTAHENGCAASPGLVILEKHGEELNYFVIPVREDSPSDIYEELCGKYGVITALSHRFLFRDVFLDGGGTLHLSVNGTGQTVSGHENGTADMILDKDTPVVVRGPAARSGAEYSAYPYTCFLLMSR